MQWTQDESIAYECACEVIGDLRAILTGEIAEEMAKQSPDGERVAMLSEERSRLFVERDSLEVKDAAAVARVRSEYGARVSAWRAENITPERRRAAWEQALANARIEGLEPSADFLADVEAEIAGTMTGEQLIAASLARALAADR